MNNSSSFGTIGLPELMVVLFLCVGCVAYFIPTIVAALRQKTNILAIFVLNFFLGWSVIGWVVALVWAMSTQVVDATPAPARVSVLCSSCGKYNAGGTRFCAHCGAPTA
jgi:hypothetical protein